jgi:pseudouridine-5'-phosphate glycosidase
MVIANPIPEAYAMPRAVIDAAIERALDEARVKGVQGKDSTPFLLARVCELTGGDSLASNIQLVLNNAQLAASIATALSGLERA